MGKVLYGSRRAVIHHALGGYRKGAPVQEAEFYDPLIQKWLPIANMIKGR